MPEVLEWVRSQWPASGSASADAATRKAFHVHFFSERSQLVIKDGFWYLLCHGVDKDESHVGTGMARCVCSCDTCT